MSDSEDRKNTIQCQFPQKSKRPSAYEIHLFLEHELKLPTDEVLGLQLDIFINSVFLKLRTPGLCDDIVNANEGSRTFKYLNGSVCTVQLKHAGFGLRNVRVFNIPFEVRDETIERSLKPYGKVEQITREKWSPAYRYQCQNGIRTVKIIMNQHIPSFLYMAGNRAYITYAGQPQTCSFCHGSGHVRKYCPRIKQPTQLPAGGDGDTSYSSVFLGKVPSVAQRHTNDAMDVDIENAQGATVNEGTPNSVPPMDVANVVPPTTQGTNTVPNVQVIDTEKSASVLTPVVNDVSLPDAGAIVDEDTPNSVPPMDVANVASVVPTVTQGTDTVSNAQVIVTEESAPVLTSAVNDASLPDAQVQNVIVPVTVAEIVEQQNVTNTQVATKAVEVLSASGKDQLITSVRVHIGEQKGQTVSDDLRSRRDQYDAGDPGHQRSRSQSRSTSSNNKGGSISPSKKEKSKNRKGKQKPASQPAQASKPDHHEQQISASNREVENQQSATDKNWDETVRKIKAYLDKDAPPTKMDVDPVQGSKAAQVKRKLEDSLGRRVRTQLTSPDSDASLDAEMVPASQNTPVLPPQLQGMDPPLTWGEEVEWEEQLSKKNE